MTSMLDRVPRTTAPAANRRELLQRLLSQRAGGTSPAGGAAPPVPTIEPDLARRGEPFPLTEIQQAYWIGRSAAYDFGDVSIHAYVEVDGGAVDLPRLERSWQRVVERHDMLRAVVLPDGQQRILPEVPGYQLRVADLRGRDGELVAGSLAATREELSHQVLDAHSWPGFDIRATLLDGGRTRVHISIDLLHVDGGSLMILIDDWMRLYQDGTTQLPPLELSYRDYALGEIALRDTDVYQRSTQYWQERVRTLPPAPALPVVAASGPGAGTRFRRRSATLEPAAWQRLKARATRSGLTPSAVLLAAYADVLARWSRHGAFTLNVTLFNRLPMHPQVNRILGDFTSMVLLEAATSPERSFAQRCAATQKELWAGLEHRHVSGVRVLRELARVQERTAGASMPIVFTSMLDLAVQGFRPPFSALAGLGEVVHSITQTPQVWLDYQVLEEDGALSLTWDSVEDVFPPGLIDDMFAANQRLLHRLADEDAAWQGHDRSEAPPEQLAQRAQLNATETAVPGETLATLFLRQATTRPDHPAVITAGCTLTYAETRRWANRLGRTLAERGAVPNTLVAVVMDKGWEQAVATLGIHLAGAAYLPVDPSLPEERRRYLLEHGQVRLVVTQPCLDRRLEWPAGIERVLVDAEDPPPAGEDWLVPVQGPGDLSHVIYTSGSTGLPKGVMIEHRNVVNRIVDVNRRLGVGPADRMLALSALHHDLSVYDIFGVLAAGATMVIPDAAESRDPGHWAELMAGHGVTLWNSVPAFLQMLVEYLEQRSDLPALVPRTLRSVVLAGDWIPVTLPDRLRGLVEGVEVVASGGPTETTIWDVWYPVGQVDPAWPSIPYGKPMNNTRYHVLNEALEPCPVWVPGQLYIAGAGLARGYWRDEAKTRERFITCPRTGERIYRSGDIGRYLPDGNIEFLGRDDLQVKIRGCRIELGEIESTLQQHPALAAAVVTAAGGARDQARLVAYVVPRKAGAKGDGSDGHGSSGHGSDGHGGDGHPDGKKLSEFKREHLNGVAVLDAVDRVEFKLNQWGIRRDADREVIALPDSGPRLTPDGHATRRSVRDFSTDLLPLPAFGELMRSLTQVEMEGLPKYRYPSGGGLYPVQTYVYIKPDRVEGLPAGVYYHDPKGHRLVLMSPGALLDSSTQMPHNRAIFDGCAFVIFLVGQLAAVQPLYGGLARDFCLLEAGYMSQLLMMVAPEHRIGLCPIGAMEFDPVRSHFQLDDTHVLVHLLYGGLAGEKPPQAAPSAASGDGLVGELRGFLSKKLPSALQPSAYVVLDGLPLTPNGKVDRTRLPAPDAVPVPPPEADVPPRNDIERSLAVIAREILQTEQVGVHQNFFDLGGTSLHMVRILNRVRSAFGRDVPVTEIFRHPTISSLAAYLSEQDGGERAAGDSDQRASQRKAARGRRRAGQREQSGSGPEGGGHR